MNILSLLLVITQLVLILLIASPAQALMPKTLPAVLGCLLLSLGIAFFMWAAFSLKWKNLTAMPEPVRNGHLIEQGPYRYIRHPMYTALIVCAIGAAIGHGDGLKVLYVVLLIMVLWVKLRREETFLTAAYPAYASYMARTHALIPQLL